jgi:hypothetical protein
MASVQVDLSFLPGRHRTESPRSLIPERDVDINLDAARQKYLHTQHIIETHADFVSGFRKFIDEPCTNGTSTSLRHIFGSSDELSL